MCFMEKIHLFNKLYSDMTYSAVGNEFNVIESVIYIK